MILYNQLPELRPDQALIVLSVGILAVGLIAFKFKNLTVKACQFSILAGLGLTLLTIAVVETSHPMGFYLEWLGYPLPFISRSFDIRTNLAVPGPFHFNILKFAFNILFWSVPALFLIELFTEKKNSNYRIILIGFLVAWLSLICIFSFHNRQVKENRPKKIPLSLPLPNDRIIFK